jgi:hypothetical protein
LFLTTSFCHMRAPDTPFARSVGHFLLLRSHLSDKIFVKFDFTITTMLPHGAC